MPLHDLPLQTVLHFDACPADLATSYLQLVCLAQGRVEDSKSLQTLYLTSRAGASPERAQDKHLHIQYIPPAQPDLRRSLTQLQVVEAISISNDISSCGNADDHSPDKFRRMAKAAEARSFADSGLRRPSSEVLRVSFYASVRFILLTTAHRI